MHEDAYYRAGDDQVSLQPAIVILPALSGTSLCNSGGTINEESIHLRVVPT